MNIRELFEYLKDYDPETEIHFTFFGEDEYWGDEREHFLLLEDISLDENGVKIVMSDR